MDSLGTQMVDIDLSSETQTDENENIKSNQSKSSYKDRKIEHKLKKYETILKNVEHVDRELKPTKFLFVGNCGLDNNISREYLFENFEKYGKIIDIVMQKKKSYSFIIYENELSTQNAIDHLQGKVIETSDTQSAMCYYLFPVNKVPDLCELANNLLPNGLIYVEDFIDEQYAKEISDSILNDSAQLFSDLKNRRVKHYGYEFRYGTNDVDETKPLENKIPAVCEKLLEKCLNSNLIHVKPDQLTVNLYEPGQGIPPHVDNVNAFDNYIMSLSLLSSVVMEFRLKQGANTLLNTLYLKPNSLVIMKSDSRYKWSHSIAERKHDLIRLNAESSNVTIVKRDLRMSLTFRKIIEKSKVSDGQKKDASNENFQMPSNDSDAAKFESSYVHTVYNQIAEHFSNTRHSAWPGVAEFINSLNKYSMLLDVGCGNGKYLNLRNDIFAFGCDYSSELVNICQKRNFNCFISDCLHVACADNFFDSVICIAVLHHLSTPTRRIKAIEEMLRILKIGGLGLVTVWAQEQKLNNQESYYIKQKKTSKKELANQFRLDKSELNATNERSTEILTTQEENDSKPAIHDYGKPFEKQDLFVTWHYKKMNEKKLTQLNEDDNVYLRFYHVFINGELEELFKNIKNVKLVRSFYEQGNWCVVFEKFYKIK